MNFVKKIYNNYKEKKKLVAECVEFCVQHEDFILHEINPQTEEEIIKGFQKLLDANLLFEINFYYSLMGKAFLEKGFIIPKNNKIKIPERILL